MIKEEYISEVLHKSETSIAEVEEEEEGGEARLLYSRIQCHAIY